MSELLLGAGIGFGALIAHLAFEHREELFEAYRARQLARQLVKERGLILRCERDGCQTYFMNQQTGFICSRAFHIQEQAVAAGWQNGPYLCPGCRGAS